MIAAAKHQLLHELARLCELSPEIRVGQLLDFLGVLCEDCGDQSLAIIEDDDLLRVIQNRLAEMAHQRPNVA